MYAYAIQIRWRTGRDWQLATSALVLDHSVHVWDVRRPFLPLATFSRHQNVITGIGWTTTDSFFSCGKDGQLLRNRFDSHAIRPLEEVRAAPIAFDARDKLVVAVRKFIYSIYYFSLHQFDICST